MWLPPNGPQLKAPTPSSESTCHKIVWQKWVRLHEPFSHTQLCLAIDKSSLVQAQGKEQLLGSPVYKDYQAPETAFLPLLLPYSFHAKHWKRVVTRKDN